MILKNALIFSEDNQFHKRNLFIRNNLIISDETFDQTEQEWDLSGCYVIPGLVDTHLHGAMGADFSDVSIDAIETIAKYELTHGITSFLPATMTLSECQLAQICRKSAKYVANTSTQSPYLATFLGIYMEGPFFSAAKCGAQNPAFLQNPNHQLFTELQKCSNGLIRVCSVAPELPGTDEFIHYVLKSNTFSTPSIALGHTTATEKEAAKALQDGANRITHFYNAMSHYTDIEKAVLTQKDCYVELICDGRHNSKERILHAFETFGPDHVILISDSMRATGMPDGTYSLGGQDVFVSGKDALLPSGTRAGSVCNLFDCLLTCIQMGVPKEQAVRAVTANPAQSLHLEDSIGSIAYGLHADLIVLNRDFKILHIMKNGQFI